MQETPIIKAPDSYDWTEFTLKERGFLATWCRENKYQNGEPFSYKTAFALIRNEYRGESGPKISEIIKAALRDGLIHEIEEQQAA